MPASSLGSRNFKLKQSITDDVGRCSARRASSQRGSRKKVLAPSARKQTAQSACTTYPLRIKCCCNLYAISPSHWRYVQQRDPEDAVIAAALIALPEAHIRWGFGLMYLHLRSVQAKTWNHKRVWIPYVAQLRAQLCPQFNRGSGQVLCVDDMVVVATPAGRRSLVQYAATGVA